MLHPSLYFVSIVIAFLAYVHVFKIEEEFEDNNLLLELCNGVILLDISPVYRLVFYLRHFGSIEAVAKKSSGKGIHRSRKWRLAGDQRSGSWFGYPRRRLYYLVRPTRFRRGVRTQSRQSLQRRKSKAWYRNIIFVRARDGIRRGPEEHGTRLVGNRVPYQENYQRTTWDGGNYIQKLQFCPTSVASLQRHYFSLREPQYEEDIWCSKTWLSVAQYFFRTQANPSSWHFTWHLKESVYGTWKAKGRSLWRVFGWK